MFTATSKTGLAALVMALSFQAAAQSLIPMSSPPLDPPDPAGVYLARPLAAAEATVRQMPPAQAKELLSSSEGPAWRVFQIQAPGCQKPIKPLKDRRLRKEAAVACRQAIRSCKQAASLAKKYRAQNSCSALYKQTTVWLTTVRK